MSLIDQQDVAGVFPSNQETASVEYDPPETLPYPGEDSVQSSTTPSPVSNTCIWVLRGGNRKGQLCGSKTVNNSNHCRAHTKVLSKRPIGSVDGPVASQSSLPPPSSTPVLDSDDDDEEEDNESVEESSLPAVRLLEDEVSVALRSAFESDAPIQSDQGVPDSAGDNSSKGCGDEAMEDVVNESTWDGQEEFAHQYMKEMFTLGHTGIMYSLEARYPKVNGMSEHVLNHPKYDDIIDAFTREQGKHIEKHVTPTNALLLLTGNGALKAYKKNTGKNVLPEIINLLGSEKLLNQKKKEEEEEERSDAEDLI